MKLKKTIFIGLAAIAVTAIAGWNVYMATQSNNEMTDLMLANVEALAQNEHGGWNSGWDIITQGFTKDEYSIAHPCFEDRTNEGGGPYHYTHSVDDCYDGGSVNCTQGSC
jgi:hypothetical protein